MKSVNPDFSKINFAGVSDETIQTACESILNLCSVPPYGITGNDLVVVVGDKRDLNPRFAKTLESVVSKSAGEVHSIEIPEGFDTPLTDEQKELLRKQATVLLRVYSGTMSFESDKMQTDWLRTNLFSITYGAEKTNIRLNCLAGYTTPAVLEYLTRFEDMQEVDVTSKSLILLLNEFKGDELKIKDNKTDLNWRIPTTTPILASTHTSERSYMNLPSGETCFGPDVKGGLPTGVNGTIVLGKGCRYNLSDEIQGDIVFDVESGMIVNVLGEELKGKDLDILGRIYSELYDKTKDGKNDKIARALGELGLNTNHIAGKIPFIEQLYNKIILEKQHRGIHWAYGGNEHFPGYKEAGVALQSLKGIHVDNFMPNATVILPDGKLLYDKGVLNRDILKEHEEAVRIEMGLTRD